MSGVDIFWLFLRWLHVLAAASWFGSALFYATVMSPSFKSESSSNNQSDNVSWKEKIEGAIAGEWREFLEITAFILVISGALLAFNRLSQPNISSTYAVILGVKVALTTVMAFYTFRRISPLIKGIALANWMRFYRRLVAGLGALVILLAVILRAVYDKSIIP